MEGRGREDMLEGGLFGGEDVGRGGGLDEEVEKGGVGLFLFSMLLTRSSPNTSINWKVT